LSGINEHRNAHQSDDNMHEVKGFPAANKGNSYRKNIQGASEWQRDFRQPNAKALVRGYVAPLTEVDGDVYALTSPLLDVDGIVFQSGTTVRFTFTSGYENIYAVGNYLQISGEANVLHNGVWLISAVNASFLEVTNPAITDSSNDQASGSLASGYVSHQDYDPQSLSNGQSIPINGLVRYYSIPDLWYGDEFQEGDEYYNEATQTKDLYNGNDIVSDSGIITVKVSMTAAEIQAGTNVLAVAAPGTGKAIEMISMAVKYVFVSTVYDVAVTIDAKIDTATERQFNPANFLGTASSTFLMGAAFAGTGAISIVEDKKLEVFADAVSTAGDGTADVYITYRIITL